MYTTEAEQLAQLRQWWKRYGKMVFLGLMVVFLIIGGWRYWQGRQVRLEAEASILFDHLLVSKDKNDNAAFEGQGNYLLNTYPRTLYAQMGALIMAGVAVDQNQLDNAKERLQWVIDDGRHTFMRQLARLRLARIQLALHDYQAAQKTLQKIEDKSYSAEVHGLEGDIARAQGNIALADQHYQQALKDMTKDTDLRLLYQLKQQQLPKATQ
ncbi:MAG: hypothetical protein K0R12_1378 [Gammaproteobacteria bacterium]|nr:hypothetical protein [Gammaproteobacteria bacterium]